MYDDPSYPSPDVAVPPPAAAPTPPRSGAPKALGVLSIVFASLMILGSLPASCSGCVGSSMTGIGSMAANLGDSGDMPKEIISAVGMIYKLVGIQGFVFLVMSSILLAVGIGQVQYKRWAASGSVVWGVVALLSLVAFYVAHRVLMGNALDMIAKSVAEQGREAAMAAEFMSSVGSWMTTWMSSWGLVMFVPYPIILIAFFRSQDVKRSMTA